MVFVNLYYFIVIFTCFFIFKIVLIWSPDLVFVIDDWTLHKQLECLCVYKGWNMNKFEINELMSNWMNELEIYWNKLKCNFFKNHSHLDSKRQKSSTLRTLYFYHVYVSTKVGIWINLKLMNWCQTEWMNLKYVEINWNVIFSKIILILILKGKRAVPIQLYIFIMFMCVQRLEYE